MKLNNIRITNYRCFKEADSAFDDHITLIVGKNGAGKTAILDAVAVAVSTFLLGIDGGVSRGISKDDARYEFHDLNGTVDPQHQFPVSIDSVGDCLDNQAVKWVRSLDYDRRQVISSSTDILLWHRSFVCSEERKEEHKISHGI